MSLVRFIRLTSVTILLLFSDRPSDILLLSGSVLTLSQVLRSHPVGYDSSMLHPLAV